MSFASFAKTLLWLIYATHPKTLGEFSGRQPPAALFGGPIFHFVEGTVTGQRESTGQGSKSSGLKYTLTQSKKPSSTCQNPILFLAQSSEDFLTNCKSALDYSIWEIAGFFAKRELIGSPWGGDRIHFPICAKPDPFSDWKKEAGLSDWALDMHFLGRKHTKINAAARMGAVEGSLCPVRVVGFRCVSACGIQCVREPIEKRYLGRLDTLFGFCD
jgi:hypothetical protein